ncbi:unnamed protein product [Allacma fusca]|uniref:ESF1 homolog n=1 Tax=Allacma fusca TaxID=39272 RepID=A0A8J2PHS0_9HEXA|nr:unnamed protein product [Allacma fusca]
MDKDKYKSLMSEAVKDERFSQALKNPLYRRVPKKEKRVEIDKRFQSMFHDKKFKLKYHMDTRGRPIDTTSNENLKRLYNLPSEDESEDIGADEKKPEKGKIKSGRDKDVPENDSNESSESSDEEITDHFEDPDITKEAKAVLSKAEKKKLHCSEVDYTRGEGKFVSEDSSSDSSDTEGEDEAEDENAMHEWGEIDKDAERTEDATRRLALCNMDWDRLNASDLMVLFHSFVPPGGILKSVSIYTSEFGKQRLAEEELHGPKELVAEKLDSEDEDEVVADDDEEGAGYDMEKLRKYQLNRLKYFYAVLEFDTKESADKVYTECDGMEYESSATRVDLRFIPEEMTFDDEPKDRCESLPDAKKYRPRFFTTTALQQMKVDLTWDETDPRRKELTERIFNSKENVEDEDIRAYLASSSDSEEEENTDARADDFDDDKKDPVLKYKALLQSMEDTDKKKKDKDVEMEITWGVGLKKKSEELVKRKLEEQSKAKMTPWEEMLAKRREKRKTRKAERKGGEQKEGSESASGSGSDEGTNTSESGDEGDEIPFSDDDVDIDMNDPYFKQERSSNDVFKSSSKTKSKNPAKSQHSEEKSDKQNMKDAELELLLMDEEKDNKRHFSMKKILEAESNALSKKKKNKKWKKEKPAPETDEFQVDLQDNRFSALYLSHHFNVDPSDPNFKKTKGMEALVSEKQKRRLTGVRNKDSATSADTPVITDAESGDISPAKKSKSDLAYLVKSIKGKTESMKSRKQNISRLKKYINT